MTGQTPLERELREEQDHVDLVLAQLHRAMASAKDLARESRARFTSTRESWLREEDGTALFERDAFAFVAARRMAILDGEHDGLVFGRLDFEDREVRYVGRLGVRTDDYEPLVIDWRASAAEPFYRATPVQPMDVIRRRVLSSRDDKVIGIEDDVLMPQAVPDSMTVIGDGALMSALERARGTKMHDIVATIQAEQDQAIRAPYQGFTVITGGPGTGKTVVGLHRVAFLLYTHRRRLSNGGVLVVGPSSIFMDYIERVLPSLGEESVTLKSLGQVASDRLGFSATERENPQAWQIKGGLAMVEVLRRLVESTPEDSRHLLVTVKGEPLSVGTEELARIRRDCLGRLPYNDARTLAETQLLSLLWARADFTADMDRARFDDLVRSSWAFTTFFARWWPPLEPTEALVRLRDPGFVNSLGILTNAQAVTLAQSIDPESWKIADIALLDELGELLGRVPAQEDEDEPIFGFTSTEELVTISDRLIDHRHLESGALHDTFAHILVDEAQDITPMQWRMIFRRGVNASWTIVGDPAQSSWPDKDEPMRCLKDLIGRRQQRSFRLSTNYRSPKEAFELATAYIRSFETDIDIPQAVRSTGIAPRLLVAASTSLGQVVARATAQLLNDVDGTIGIIAESRRWDQLTRWLGANPRVIMLDPMSSKGLEFDGVVVVDPDGIASDGPCGVRTLYVALTRPTQILVTVDCDSPGAWRQFALMAEKAG